MFLSKCNGKNIVSYFPDEVNDIKGPKPTDDTFPNVGNGKQNLVQAVGAIANGVQNVLSSPTVQNILSNITVQNVLNDPVVQAVLSNGNVQSVFSNPIIQGIITNPSFQGLSLQTILNSISPVNLSVPLTTTTTTVRPPSPSTTPAPIPPVPRPTSVFSQAQVSRPRPQQNRPQRPTTNNNELITSVLNGLGKLKKCFYLIQ